VLLLVRIDYNKKNKKSKANSKRRCKQRLLPLVRRATKKVANSLIGYILADKNIFVKFFTGQQRKTQRNIKPLILQPRGFCRKNLKEKNQQKNSQAQGFSRPYTLTHYPLTPAL